MKLYNDANTNEDAGFNMNAFQKIVKMVTDFVKAIIDTLKSYIPMPL